VHNGYAFADLNPIMKVDPSGNLAERDIINVVVIAVAVVSAVITLGAAAYVAGGLALAMFGVADAIGVALDAGAAGIAAARITSNNSVRPMPSEVETWLERAEYVMAGFGIGVAIARIGSAITAWRTPPKLAAQSQSDPPVTTNKPASDDGATFEKKSLSQSSSSDDAGSASPRQRRHGSDSDSDTEWTSNAQSRNAQAEIEQQTLFARALDVDSAPQDVRDRFGGIVRQTKALHKESYRPPTLLKDIDVLQQKQAAYAAAVDRGGPVNPFLIHQRNQALQYVVSTFGWKVAHSNTHKGFFTFERDEAFTKAFAQVEDILTSMGYGAKQ
jgi:hypothetical protein